MNARTIRDAVPALGRASRSTMAQQVIRAARRSAVLESPAAFAAHELLGGAGRVGYHSLVGGGLAVLRHRTRDVDIFDEVLVPPRAYDPPPQAAKLLAGMMRPRIVDLGGNIGLFAIDCLRRFPNARITSVEADPMNLPLLNACRAHNPNADWTLLPVAAGRESTTMGFVAGQFADSAVSEHGTTEVMMIDAIRLFADADFVKIDIEGSEWPILGDPRWPQAMDAVAVLALEWHARGCPTSDPHAAGVDAVRAAGFTVDPGRHGWHHGNIWGWR